MKFKVTKQELKLIAVTLLFLSAVIGFMSYSEMHPKEGGAPIQKELYIVSEYYLHDAAFAKLVPNDARPITAFAGTVSFDNKSEPVLEIVENKPTFAQRQFAIMLRLKNLPQNPAKFITLLEKEIENWKFAGNDVSSLFFDYRPEKPDFKLYDATLNAIRKNKATMNFHLIPIIDPLWVKQNNGYLDLKDISSFFVVELKSLSDANTLLDDIKNIGYVFKIKLPSNYTSNIDFAKKLLNAKYFSNAILDIDGTSKLPEEKDKVRVLPSFFYK